jgi:uncharacterized protein DUF2617
VIYSASTLRYRLLDGPARLEPLRVLDARNVDWCGRCVSFLVLAASHAVLLRQGNRQLMELMACALPEGGARSLLELAADQPAEICIAAHGLICSVRLTPFPLGEGDGLCGDFATADQLAVAYPTSLDARTPFTRIGWRISGTRLSIETVHTYPEEEQGVRSESRFELRDAP